MPILIIDPEPWTNRGVLIANKLELIVDNDMFLAVLKLLIKVKFAGLLIFNSRWVADF
jgi:hypothetical protein